MTLSLGMCASFGLRVRLIHTEGPEGGSVIQIPLSREVGWSNTLDFTYRSPPVGGLDFPQIGFAQGEGKKASRGKDLGRGEGPVTTPIEHPIEHSFVTSRSLRRG